MDVVRELNDRAEAHNVTSKQFKAALQQVRVLDIKLQDVRTRSARAKQSGRRDFCCSYASQISCIENVRNYICRRAAELAYELQRIEAEAAMLEQLAASNEDAESDDTARNGSDSDSDESVYLLPSPRMTSRHDSSPSN